MLKTTFISLAEIYTGEKKIATDLWEEIASHYGNKKRHYHNLDHLEYLLEELLPIKTQIKDWDTLLFSLYYHDIIYNPLKTTNEEKSAEFAANRLQLIEAPASVIKGCVAQILATKKHAVDDNSDTNYFTDADLSILGQPWEIYSDYYTKIRREYALYPDLIYVPGRKKVLRHFLEMQRIFKTEYFFNSYERQARENMHQELESL